MSRWTEFHESHGKRNFTPVFNSYLERLIDQQDADLLRRVEAWILRTSWGEHSDACVDSEGIILNQTDCTRRLKVPQDRRQRVSEVFQQLKREGFIRIVKQRGEIEPIEREEGEAFASSSPQRETLRLYSEEKENIRFSNWITEIWAKDHPEAFQEYTKAEGAYKTFRHHLLKLWRGSEDEAPSDREARSEGSGTEIRTNRTNSPKGSELHPYWFLNLKQTDSSSSVLLGTKPKAAKQGDDDDEIRLITKAIDGNRIQARRLLTRAQQGVDGCTVHDILELIPKCRHLAERPQVDNPSEYLCAVVISRIEHHIENRGKPEAGRGKQLPEIELRMLEDYLKEVPGDEQMRRRAAELRAQLNGKAHAQKAGQP